MILDGGACRGGIESTVVDVTRLVPRVLRPGLVTAPMLEAVIGSVEVGGATDEVTRSPGQQERHYAPRARLILVPPAQLLDTILDFERMHTRFAVVTFGPTVERWKGQHPVFEYLDCVNLTSDAVQAAEKLYQTLHTLDEPLIDCILVEEPPDTPEWAGVRDRVKRGAH
jgi:L-threonylcarbamoyladenylate synthase